MLSSMSGNFFSPLLGAIKTVFFGVLFFVAGVTLLLLLIGGITYLVHKIRKKV